MTFHMRDTQRGMVARFPCFIRFCGASNRILVAAAAGILFGAGFRKAPSHRAILRHAVLVCGSKYG